MEIQQWWGGGVEVLVSHVIPAMVLVAWRCGEHPDTLDFCGVADAVDEGQQVDGETKCPCKRRGEV